MRFGRVSYFASAIWASCQIRKLAGCACARNAGTFFPPPWVRNPDMHHGTCVTHVPWCMPGPLTSGFLWSWWRGKCSKHSRRMRNPQFYVSGKRPMEDESIQDQCHTRPTEITNMGFSAGMNLLYLSTEKDFPCRQTCIESVSYFKSSNMKGFGGESFSIYQL